MNGIAWSASYNNVQKELQPLRFSKKSEKMELFGVYFIKG